MQSRFEAQGHTVTVSDLYAKQFNPVASATDFAERSNPDYLVYALEQRHAQKTNTLPADIAAELELLKQCRDHMFGDEAIHGDLNTMLRPVLRGSLGYAGFDVLEPFAAYHVPYITQEARVEMLEQLDDA
eukprot:gene12505-12294_t